jgi:CubicO group peptidase (beta-lactamase class C family)
MDPTVPTGRASYMRVLVVLALFQLPGSACFAASASLNEQMQSAIENVVAQYKVPGVSVSGGIPSEGAPRNFVTGRTTIAPDAPAINDATLFQVGSVTKPLTAILILMLEARGLFDIDDPAGDYVSGFPTWRTSTGVR